MVTQTTYLKNRAIQNVRIRSLGNKRGCRAAVQIHLNVEVVLLKVGQRIVSALESVKD